MNIARDIGHAFIIYIPLPKNVPVKGIFQLVYLFTAIDKLPYTGYMGIEYFPEHDPIQGLKEALSLAGKSWEGQGVNPLPLKQ